MKDLLNLLQGGDLRSIGQAEQVVERVNSQSQFDELFQCLHSDNRLVVMRAADAIEKITLDQPEFLLPHKKEVLAFLDAAKDKEFKWHLAQLIPRLIMNKKQLIQAWNHLSKWARDEKQSRIVRVNSIQSLHDLAMDHSSLFDDLKIVIESVKKENIPSLNARIRKLGYG